MIEDLVSGAVGVYLEKRSLCIAAILLFVFLKHCAVEGGTGEDEVSGISATGLDIGKAENGLDVGAVGVFGEDLAVRISRARTVVEITTCTVVG